MGYYGTLAPFVGMAVGLGAIGPLMNAVDKLVPPIPDEMRAKIHGLLSPWDHMNSEVQLPAEYEQRLARLEAALERDDM